VQRAGHSLHATLAAFAGGEDEDDAAAAAAAAAPTHPASTQAASAAPPKPDARGNAEELKQRGVAAAQAGDYSAALHAFAHVCETSSNCCVVPLLEKSCISPDLTRSTRTTIHQRQALLHGESAQLYEMRAQVRCSMRGGLMHRAPARASSCAPDLMSTTQPSKQPSLCIITCRYRPHPPQERATPTHQGPLAARTRL